MFYASTLLRGLVVAVSALCFSLGGATSTRAASAKIDGWHQIHFGMNKEQVLAALPGAQLYHNLCDPMSRHGWDCEVVRGQVEVEDSPFIILVYFGQTSGGAANIALGAEHPTPELYQRVLASLPLSQGTLTMRKGRDQSENLLPSGGSCADTEASFRAGRAVANGEWMQRTYLGDAVTLELDGGIITAEYLKYSLCPQAPTQAKLALGKPAFGDFVNAVNLEIEYLAPGQSPLYW